jgi:imidazolonepropionase-like amidohydrolase
MIIKKAVSFLVVCLVLLNLDRKSAQESSYLAITHITVVDVVNGSLIPDQTVLIHGNKIKSIGENGSTNIPRASKIIDGSGKYLIPGLWDAHVHLSYVGSCALPVLVAHGVTSVRDLGSLPQDIQTWQALIGDGKLFGPRIKSAGYNIENGRWLDAVANILQTSETLKKYNFFELAPRLRIDNIQDVKRVVDSLKGAGSNVVKFRNLERQHFLALADECKKAQLPLVGHAPQGTSLAEASRAGIASIEHGETISNSLDNLDSSERAGQFKILSRNRTMVTPTLISDYSSKLSTDEQMMNAITDTNGVKDPRNKYVSDKLRRVWQLTYDSKFLNGTQDWKSFFLKSASHLREAYRNKVPMLAGTDLGVILVYPGSSIHEELILMVEKIGMTSADALRAATIHPAMFFKMQDSLGTIAPGKLADLVLLDANPLLNIRHTQGINGVIINGRYFDKPALKDMLSSAKNDIVKN